MKSLKELFQIGRGPSSSHTMGPEKIANFFKNKYSNANYKVILYGSLALTGKGHGTDRVLRTVLGEKTEIVFDAETKNIKHPNTLDMFAYSNEGVLLGQIRAYSIGGGAVEIENETSVTPQEVYKLNTFDQIKEYCEEHEIRICDYVYENEPEIKEYLTGIWEQMQRTIKHGLHATGILPGGLNVQRKAHYLYTQHHIDEAPETCENRLVCSYAFAVAEENADGQVIVTAPTCGACGVLPAVLYYEYKKRHFSDDAVIDALATAGLIGNLIKTNASISGAECGCQAEVGSACAMAAGGLGELFQMNIEQIEYATEIAIEHHLGLTCDPVNGLVQIPCIERNAVASMRALNAVNLANFLTETRKVSLDTIIQTMYETGKDMSSRYRETSEAGLARTYIEHK